MVGCLLGPGRLVTFRIRGDYCSRTVFALHVVFEFCGVEVITGFRRTSSIFSLVSYVVYGCSRDTGLLPWRVGAEVAADAGGAGLVFPARKDRRTTGCLAKDGTPGVTAGSAEGREGVATKSAIGAP